MLLNARLARRTAIVAIGTGAVVGAMFAAPRQRWPIHLPTAPPATWRKWRRVSQRALRSTCSPTRG